ncbi:MAG: helix-turn-helix domain-containing protein, partial [Myxococcota bacterium]
MGSVVPAERLLQDVWGYAPTVRSRAVDNAISRLRKKLGTDAQQIETVYGQGFCLVPTDDEELLGRQSELATLGELVERHSLVNVFGLGGIGKSALVRALVAGWGHHLWLEFHDPQNVNELECQLAEALELSPQAIAQIPERLDALGRTLVVFDGAEHLGPWLIERIRRWLDAAPTTAVVLTSRVLLDDEVGLELGPLAPDAAMALLRQGSQHFAEPEAPRTQLTELLELVDRLPLAIELVAARLRVLPAEELVTWLHEHGVAILDGPDRRLSTTLKGCWSLLGAAERRCLSVAAMLGHRFRADPVQQIAGLSPAPTLDALERLLRTGMLQRRGRFYTMLDLVRTMAFEHVDAEMRDAFVSWATKLSEQLFRERRGRFTEEPSLLVSVLLRALEWSDTPADRARLLLGIRVHDEEHGPLTRTRDAFLALPTESLPDELAVDVWVERGLLHIDADQRDEAYRCLAHASELAAALPSVQKRLRTQIYFTNLVRMLRGADEALPMARQVFAEVETIEASAGLQVSALSCLEGCLTIAGEFEEAHRHVLRSIVLLESRPDWQADKRVRLGFILSQLGEQNRALHELEAAFAHARHAGLDRTVVSAGRQLGNLHLYAGATTPAREAYTVVREVSERIGDPAGRIGARLGLAAVTAAEDADQGIQALELVREDALLVGRVREAAVASLEIGKVRHRGRQWQAAESSYRECLALVEPIGWNMVIAMARSLLALLLATVDRHADA